MTLLIRVSDKRIIIVRGDGENPAGTNDCRKEYFF